MASILGLGSVLGVFNDLAGASKSKMKKGMKRAADSARSKVAGRSPGHLAAGWEVIETEDGYLIVNTEPDAHRYEYGFSGTDSLGRHVSQPPRSFVPQAVVGLGDLLKDYVSEEFQ